MKAAVFLLNHFLNRKYRVNASAQGGGHGPVHLPVGCVLAHRFDSFMHLPEYFLLKIREVGICENYVIL